MGDYRGVLGLALLLGVAWALSSNRRGISLQTLLAALGLQVAFATLVLRWGPGERALGWAADRVADLIGFTDEGTSFLFGDLYDPGSGSVFALAVLPVIIFLGALIGLLFHLRVIQYATHYLGGALARLLGVSKVESLYASTVIFLGQSEAPLMIAPYLRSLRAGQLFTVMVGGLTAAAGSTLVGYSLLGAPLEYLLAATVMNAPAALLFAKLMWPDSTPVEREPASIGVGADAVGTTKAAGAEPQDLDELDVREVRDTESRNAIDAIGRGALAGGRIAITVGALLIAFVALIALANGVLGAVGGWFGYDGLTFERILGWLLAPLAWLLGVPWSEAPEAGSWIGQKTVLNEFVAYADFGPAVAGLDPLTVVVVTFALAGFANLASIAIILGVVGSLAPERRSLLAALGLRALLAASLANLSNAAIAGLVFSL